MPTKGKWRFTETRAIRRFAVSRHALDETAFRLGPNVEYSSANPWMEVVQEDIVDSASFAPSFQIATDEDRLTQEVGLDVDDLELALTVADPAMHSTHVINRWPLQKVPPHFEVPKAILRCLSGRRGLIFAVLVTPRRPLSQRRGVACDPGQVVSTRSFALLPDVEGSGFPTEVVDPSAFVKLGLPAETVWIISWLSHEYDRDPEDVLCIYLNRKEAAKILQMSASDAVGQALWAEIATEILVEICTTVFGPSAEEMIEAPQDERGFLHRLSLRLVDLTGLSFDELRKKGKELEAQRLFRAYIQAGLGLGAQIRAIRLAGRQR